MLLTLKSATRYQLLAALGLLSACSSVKELGNVSLWPFGSGADKPRVYQPANSTPYLCEGNKKFFVRMLDNGASAWLILPEREVLLAQGGTSKVYTNGITKLDLSNEAVTLDVNESAKYVACVANGVAKLNVAQATQSNPEMASKAEIAQTPQVAEKSETKQVSEKSWLSTLKFWESDEQPKVAEVSPKANTEVPVKAAEAAMVVAPSAVEQAPASVTAEEKVAEPQATKPVPTASEPSGDDLQAMIKEVAGQNKQTEEVPLARDEPSSSAQEEVAKTLEAWARAWRTKNADAYLAAYSAKFKPEGISKKTWLKQRKQRVGASAGEINLALDSVKVVADAKKAEVSFIQHYTSGKFSDTVAKVLSFENESGHWLIIKETTQAKK